jgi:tagatose 1,6-diphosphate aldolase
MRFRFLDHGPLVDGELELVSPATKWVDALMRSCQHPLAAADVAAQTTSRSRVMDFIRAVPAGRQEGDARLGRVPCYHFWMRLTPVDPQRQGDRPLPRWGHAPPPVEIAGGIALRIGSTMDVEMYIGHIGYNVYIPAQGNHYAERACRLLLPLAKAHGLTRIWITCNPDNHPSRRTCERLGCQLAEIVPVPPGHPLRQRGDFEKCRYWLDL